MASASSKAIFGRRRPTARSDNMVNSSAEIIDDTPENRFEYIQRNLLFSLLLSPMTVRADAVEKETALLKSRLATPRSPQVVYDTDEEESDNNRGTNSSDQMEDSGDELDRAHEVNLVCYFSHLKRPCRYYTDSDHITTLIPVVYSRNQFYYANAHSP